MLRTPELPVLHNISYTPIAAINTKTRRGYAILPGMHAIPSTFSNRMIEMYGEAGRAWIAALPAILEAFARRWSLFLHPPFALTYNYVAPATRADGTEAVLKLGFPNSELLSEMHALQVYAGRGIVQMLEADFEQQVFLLEHIRPGVELVNLEDDEECTRIAAQVMQQLWRPAEADRPLLTVEGWTAGLTKLRSRFGGTTGPFPKHLVEAAEGIFAEFVPTQGERVVLHGDLHHWNILSAARQPWLALDPKGVVGEREYEVGALLRNPWDDTNMPSNIQHIQERRIDILAEMLGFDRQRMLGWGAAQAVLSAWWSVEDHGYGWESAVFTAEILFDLYHG